MEMDDLGRAGAFVEVVYILGEHANAVAALKLGDGAVAWIGLDLVELSAALIIKIEHELRVAVPRFRSGNLFNPVALPQPVGIAEGLEAAFGADVCRREQSSA